MNFPYHTESVHNMYIISGNKKNFEKNVGKHLIILRKGGMGGGYPFTENSARIINLIFEPFPYLINVLCSMILAHCAPPPVPIT